MRFESALALVAQHDLLRLDSASAVRPGRFARLRVEDTGVGMDEETRGQMFEPFFTTKSAGHGLGLSSVLGTVRAHEGGIAVETTRGRGTLVTVLLPSADTRDGTARESAPSAWPSKPARGPRGERGERGHARTILVADDEEQLRRSVGLILEEAGYRVILSKTGSKPSTHGMRTATRSIWPFSMS